MRELFARLLSRPGLTTEMIAASLFANVLALASPLFVIQVLNRYVAHGVDATLATLTAGVVCAIVLELAFRQIRMRLAGAVNSSYDRKLANASFLTLTHTKIGAVEQLPTGVRQEMIAGAEKVQTAYSPANVSALLDVPFALLFIGALYLLNPLLALVVIGFVLFGFGISLITLFSLRRPTREMLAASGRRGGLIASAIQAGDTVRAFNAGGFMRKLWGEETGVFHKLARRINQRQGFVQSLGMTTQAMMSTCVIAVGALQVVKGQMDVGAMIGANILAARALGPIIRLATLSEAIAKARQALNMFQEFAKLPAERGEGTALRKFTGTIEFQDLAFAHPGAKTPLFESVNLKLEPASVLVFSGSNGASKTTLARLVAGLIEPTRGKILADGVDMQQIAPEWWRSQICYLPQEPRFLNGTIAENITMANPEMPEALLNDVIDTAGLRQYVDQSTDGLDTRVTNNGANLSLGIRRRLALARALATDGMLMIVDEPTEGLDADGAGHVIEAMNEMAKRGRTVLAFSHDPQILRGAPHYVDLDSKPVPTLVRKPAEGAAGEVAPEAAANEPTRSTGP